MSGIILIILVLHTLYYSYLPPDKINKPNHREVKRMSQGIYSLIHNSNSNRIERRTWDPNFQETHTVPSQIETECSFCLNSLRKQPNSHKIVFYAAKYNICLSFPIRGIPIHSNTFKVTVFVLNKTMMP